MEIYYLSASGERLYLNRPPYYIKESELFDFNWSLSVAQKPLGDGGRVLSRRRASNERKIRLYVYADNDADMAKAVNDLHRITDADTYALTHGRLYVGNEYLTCFVTASKKELDSDWRDCMCVTLTVMPDVPCWQMERCFSFSSAAEEDTGGAKYPFRYPKRYSVSSKTTVIVNDHYAESPMVIKLYGPCEDPRFSVNGVLMGLDVTLTEGQYAIIDQREKTIVLVSDTGEKTNIFDSRLKNGNIFTYAPAGPSVLECDDGLGMDVTVIRQRSEPEWS